MDRFVPRDDRAGSITYPFVIARRAAPWQSMSSCKGRWIDSFLAMTGRGSMTYRLRYCQRAAPRPSMSSSEGAGHLDMRHAHFLEAVALRCKTTAGVKAFGTSLGVHHDLAIATLASGGHQGLQHLSA